MDRIREIKSTFHEDHTMEKYWKNILVHRVFINVMAYYFSMQIYRIQ